MSGSLSLLLQAASASPAAPASGYGRLYLDAAGGPHVMLGSGAVITPLNSALSINAQTASAYTLAAADAGGIVSMASASANTLTIPLNATVPFPAGTFLFVTQQGAGPTTVGIASGGTLNAPNGQFTAQYQLGILFKLGTDAWEFVLIGGGGGAAAGGPTQTTAGFTIAAVGSSQTAAVANGAGFPNGTYCLITDGTNEIQGQVTAGGGTMSLTVQTQSVLEGATGNTMAGGATVTFSGPQGPAGPEGSSGAGPASINVQTGTSYTLALGDASGEITMNSASTNVVTVPTNASVDFPVGTIIGLLQLGTGQMSVAGSGSATVKSASSLNARAQFSKLALMQVAVDSWVLFGDMA